MIATIISFLYPILSVIVRTTIVPQIYKFIGSKVSSANLAKNIKLAGLIWDSIEEKGRLNELVTDKLTSFKNIMKAKTKLSDSDILLLNKSLAGVANAGKIALDKELALNPITEGQEENISENVETVNKAMGIAIESKEQIENVIEDVKDAINIVSDTPIKEIIGNISTEKFIEDIKDNKNTGDIIEDIVEQLPENLSKELNDIVENISEGKEVIEDIKEVVEEIKSNEDLKVVVDKIDEKITPIIEPLIEKIEDINEVVENKVDEVKEIVEPVLTSAESKILQIEKLLAEIKAEGKGTV